MLVLRLQFFVRLGKCFLLIGRLYDAELAIKTALQLDPAANVAAEAGFFRKTVPTSILIG
jgi:hypothetical protein